MMSLRWLWARQPSLRRQLLAWLLLPLIALLAVNAYFSNRAAVATANQSFDRLLLASAEAIAEDVSVKDGELVVDLPYAALELLESNLQERVFYRVIGPQGRTLTGYEDLPGPPPEAAASQGTVFYSQPYRGDRVYLVRLSKRIYGGDSSAPVTILVAETGEARDALSKQLWLEGLAWQGLIIAAATLLVGLGLYRGLRPLDRLSEVIAQRPMGELTEIQAGEVQLEVQPLIHALNQHTRRIQQLLESRQRFIADASHQMRTPLAEMRTQIEYCQRQDDAGLARTTLADVHEGVGRLSRLVTQLLTLARSEPSALAEQELELLDLNLLAAQTAGEFVPAARRKSIMLGFDPAPQPLLLRAHGALLHELIANLLDNAIAYSPPASAVSLSLLAQGEAPHARPLLVVEDQGPGIAAEQRDKVLTRFYRAPGSLGGGNGLGLAIASDICLAHGARLSLHAAKAGPGLRVEVLF